MTLGRLGTPSKMFEADQDFSDTHSWGSLMNINILKRLPAASGLHVEYQFL
jgi:hypothetical protein